MTYIPGRPKAICDRCGYERRHDELKREWTSLMVCAECWDPRPAEMTPPKVWPEGLPIRDARPELPDIFLEDNQITPEDL